MSTPHDVRRLTGPSTILVAALCLMALGTARAQGGRVHVDSVQMERDLNGDGRMDYVVRESRVVRGSRPRPKRLAIYLEARPGGGAPTWSTSWNANADAILVRRLVQIGSTATFLAIVEGEGDVDVTTIVLIDDRGAHALVTHSSDNPDGDIDLREENGQIVVESAPENLRLGKELIDASLECGPRLAPIVRLVFDSTIRQFRASAPRCIAR